MTIPAFAAGPVLAGTVVLVQEQPGSGDGGGQGQDFGKSSPVGLLLLLLFLIAVVFLVRSMTKHLKRVPATFDKDEAEVAEDPADAGSTKTASAETSEKQSTSGEAEEAPAQSAAGAKGNEVS
ncbi:hypothetical protein BAY61_26660 [Prauserella marina]|uniref:Uncharacterized protein n=1 Tax=Prauserella marina TaxID=530584 RepID=A0A222VVP0_9PSEU|nr:hypothetical protein [Prauserella marina]ASR37999.1 hypothetical protein BAY61_26660 [Prauserella marina]PWV73229.1 hypothetical protein DES30_109179 [Prauserella marina]SDD68745.1 hypothetical protein SAMN05421630_11194 [Prauserella marina]